MHSDGSGRRICSTCGETYSPWTGHRCVPEFTLARSTFAERFWGFFGALIAMACLVAIGVVMWRFLGAL